MLLVTIFAVASSVAHASNCSAGSYACPTGYDSCPTQSGAPSSTICTWTGTQVACDLRESTPGCSEYAPDGEIHAYSTDTDEVEAWGTTTFGQDFCCLCEGTSSFGSLNVTGSCKDDTVTCDDGETSPTYVLDFGASITGSTGDDTITGSAYDDIIDPYVGDDVVYGGDGDDYIRGVDDADGSSDLDTIYGGAGDDTIEGGDQSDTIDGGSGNDEIWGGPGNDVILGGLGNDAIDGGTGTDTLSGGPGNDYLCGGLGGPGGGDVYYGGVGTDYMYSPSIAATPSGEDTSGPNHCGHTDHGSFLSGGSSCFYTLTSPPGGCP